MKGSEILSIKLSEEKCKACYFCISSCPQSAISKSEVINSSGYQVVMVDKEKCIGCGMCYTVCPEYVFEIDED